MFSSDILLQLGWTGLATSSFYMLFATAFALVLKVNQVWNFGQAGLMVIGYFSCYIFLQILDFPPLWAIIFSILVTVFAGCCLEKYGFGVVHPTNILEILYPAEFEEATKGGCNSLSGYSSSVKFYPIIMGLIGLVGLVRRQ